MKKEHIKVVEQVVALQDDLNKMSVDEVAAQAPEAPEPVIDRIAEMKAQAKKDGALWIEPKKRLPRLGKLDEKYRKQHAYDWEYVAGIFQHDRDSGLQPGEKKCFWFCKYPGDEDCQWEIPSEKLVYVPRMIAQLLAGQKDPVTGIEAMKYHQFDHKQLPASHIQVDGFTNQFSVVATKYQGRFLPQGIFA